MAGALAGLVEGPNIVDLSHQAFGVEAMRLEGAFGVIGDAKVIEPVVGSCSGHFGERVTTVGGGGVVVEGSAEVLELYQARQRALLRRFDLASVFPELGRNWLQAERAVNVVLGFDRGDLGAVFGGGKTVFVERKSLLQCQSTHRHVVLLAAGKVLERKGKLRGADRTEVALQAGLEPDTRLGIAVGQDFVDLRKLGEKGGGGGTVVGGNEEIDVVHGFLGAAVGARNSALGHARAGAEALEEGLGERGDLAQAKAVRKSRVRSDSGEDFFDSFSAKSFQCGDFGLFLARVFEGVERVDAELVVEHLDLFWTEALEVEELEKGAGKLGAQLFVKVEFSGGGELVELLLEGVAEALDAVEFVVLGTLHDVAVKVLDDLGSGSVGADLKGVLALEFEKESDVVKDRYEGFAGHEGGIWGLGWLGELI